MKTFDVNVTINEITYQDEFNLTIRDNKKITDVIDLEQEELLNLYTEVRHAVETNII